VSFFNDANEVAYQAVYGKHYQSGGAAVDLTGKPVSHQTWAALATELEAHLMEQ